MGRAVATTFTSAPRFILCGPLGESVVKQLNETFGEEEFAELKAVKGDRAWRDAILEEFGVQKE